MEQERVKFLFCSFFYFYIFLLKFYKPIFEVRNFFPIRLENVRFSKQALNQKFFFIPSSALAKKWKGLFKADVLFSAQKNESYLLFFSPLLSSQTVEIRCCFGQTQIAHRDKKINPN